MHGKKGFNGNDEIPDGKVIARQAKVPLILRLSVPDFSTLTRLRVYGGDAYVQKLHTALLLAGNLPSRVRTPDVGRGFRIVGEIDLSRDVAQTRVAAAREEGRDESRPSRQECLRHENGLIPNSTTSGVLPGGLSPPRDQGGMSELRSATGSEPAGGAGDAACPPALNLARCSNRIERRRAPPAPPTKFSPRSGGWAKVLLSTSSRLLHRPAAAGGRGS